MRLPGGFPHRVVEATRSAPIRDDSYLPIELRAPKGGGGGGGRGGGGGGGGGKSGSGTKTGSGGVVIVHGGGGGGGGGGQVLPVWAIIVIILVTLDVLLFLTALIIYYTKEKKTGNKIRHGRVWWKAFLVASFLWIPVLIYKKTCGKNRSRSRSLNGPPMDVTYAKIDEGGAPHDNNNWHRSAATAYGEGGTGYVPGKYEPYSTTTASSPYTTPDLSKPPHPTVTETAPSPAPPPYISPPPAGAPPPQGAAIDYYAQHPLYAAGGGTPQPSPGPTAVAFPAAAVPPNNGPVPVHNPYSMSATYAPGH